MKNMYQEPIELAVDCSSGKFLDASPEDLESRISWARQGIRAEENNERLKLKYFGVGEQLSSLKIPEQQIVDCKNYFDLNGRVRDSKGTPLENGKKETSLAKALQAHKNGEVQGVISGAQTATLIANTLTSRLRRWEFEDGKIIPPIGVEVPSGRLIKDSQTGYQVPETEFWLDVGASYETSLDNLVKQAALGIAYAKIMMDVENPLFGLLTIGEEEGKGGSDINDACKLLREKYDAYFKGRVEPGFNPELLQRKVHIRLFRDGHEGNVALKTMEETAKKFENLLKFQMYGGNRRGMKRVMRQFGSWIVGKTNFRQDLKEMVSPSSRNGAPLIGFNGNVFKSHGSADEDAMYHAIMNAYTIVQSGKMNQIYKIAKDLYSS